MYNICILKDFFAHITSHEIPNSDWIFFNQGDNLEKLNSSISFPVDSNYCFFAGKSSAFSDFGRKPTFNILSDDGLTMWLVFQISTYCG